MGSVIGYNEKGFHAIDRVREKQNGGLTAIFAISPG
jgi:hypothetical protein